MLKIRWHDDRLQLTIQCDHAMIIGITSQLGYTVDHTDGISFIDSTLNYQGFYDEFDQYGIIWIKDNSEAQLRFNALGGIEWIRNLLKA